MKGVLLVEYAICNMQCSPYSPRKAPRCATKNISLSVNLITCKTTPKYDANTKSVFVVCSIRSVHVNGFIALIPVRSRAKLQLRLMGWVPSRLVQGRVTLQWDWCK